MTIDFDLGTPLPAPTSFLPSVKAIPKCSTERLVQSLEYLRRVYLPDVRGTRRVKAVDEELESLRTDAFERSYATRWLTSLVDSIDYESVIQLAASILAVCAGTAAAGAVTRTHAFDHEGSGAVMIRLKDAPLENGDYGTVGAQTWGSACVMSEMIVEMPEEFGLGPGGHERRRVEAVGLDDDGERTSRRLRVLELGAGTGLVSLTAGKFLEGKAEEFGYDEVEVVASDFHPSILSNLRTNVVANFPPPSSPSLPSSSSVSISAHRLDWSEAANSTNALSPPFDEPFDLILGADIIYELEHALWIKTCLEKLLRRPSSSAPSDTSIDQKDHSGAHFHLMIPLRRTHTLESSTIEQVFPYLTAGHSTDHTDPAGPRLYITKKEVVLCEEQASERRGWRDGAGEVEYAYYVIEWVG
ncbi:uncharacterized protein STEHIDRAFT_93842 [Stereum hirsutum FP-91666 SS1]|uniref:uncharacterized protein n=1 Tax=Stereum hirsutum (strain FP-91666) TaxID=721885 RepID=UPI000440D315|nr:uncharacterized protein STEHIDRAFT_93842 [Stereum hirsutum FP-91666 SS1]EIM88856.1 hypothetical protein STEHIDRAFT_93842 [Stereum hirsutum FP-91666 SS1]